MIEIIYITLVFVVLAFWIYTLSRLLQVVHLNKNNKLFLILILIFIPPLGIIISWIYIVKKNLPIDNAT